MIIDYFDLLIYFLEKSSSLFLIQFVIIALLIFCFNLFKRLFNL